jgi:predicted RND superfamily exporter protein
VLLVLGALVYTFRWWRSLVVILPPLLVATVLAFGIASFPPFGVTELNSNTAFLGAIIVGNGMNVGVMLVARYLEERRAGASVEPALEVAVWSVRPGTMAAAIAAGVSYASLALTDFRGFTQFGYVGGLGMLLAWGCTFVLLPPLVRWVDRDAQSAPQPLPARAGLTAAVARLVRARPGAILVVATLATAASVFAVTRVSDATLERDMSKLRRRDTWTEGEGYWGLRMDAVLGAYITPTAVLTDDADQARRVADALRRARAEGKFEDLVTSVRTIDDVLPQQQPEKLEVLEDIRDGLTPRIRATLSPDRQELVRRLVDEGSPGSLSASDLPRTFTLGLREKDGRLDRVVLLYPRPSKALWEGRALASFVGRVRGEVASAARPGERAPRVAGSLALSTDILDAIRRDGPRASAIAFVGVVCVVIFVFGGSTSALCVIGTLLVGVVWLVAATVALDVKINFANFIAFPITFGIGVEYALNVTSRWRETRNVEEAVRGTGGAVVLCSATTIIGYSSLLMAENRALFLFGLLAVLGEITCLLAAVIALPAAIEWVGRHRRGPRASAERHVPAE